MYFTEFHRLLLTEMVKHKVEFLIIGGHAAILYGSDRTTGDLDILVKPTVANGKLIIQIFNRLKLEMDDLVAEDFTKSLVLTFGFEPDGVDLINYLQGADLEEAFSRAQLVNVGLGFQLPMLDARDLLNVKQSLNRTGRKGLTDQLDILALQKHLEINPK